MGLSNGQMGTVVGIQGHPSHMLKGTIFVIFDNSIAGTSIKLRQGHRFAGAVPIKSLTQVFNYRRTRSDVNVARRQFPFTLAFAITIHKSQAATFEHMVIDFDRSTKSANPDKKLGLQQGQAYTAISRATGREGLLLRNFDPEIIKANEYALQEMERFRKEKLLCNIWSHPLQRKTGCILTMLNIVSWNLHLKHFLCDPINERVSDIFCFTETYQANIDIKDLTNNTWSNICKGTEHGLALCYKNETVTYVKELETLGKVEMMSNLIQLNNCNMIVIIVYRQCKTSPGEFLNDLVEEINALPSQYRKIVVGDFN